MPARIPSMSRPRSASPSRCTTRMCRTSPVGCATHPCPQVQLELLQRAAVLGLVALWPAIANSLSPLQLCIYLACKAESGCAAFAGPT